jgi:hypothetical protein
MTLRDLQAFLDLLEEQPQSRAQLRTLLMGDDLSTWAQRFDRLTGIVERLAEAQQRTEGQVRALAQAQQRTEERLGQLAEAQQRTEEQVRALAQAQQRTEERLEQLAADVRALTGEVRRLADWQRGEAGRREGEHYEQRIARRAPVLFNGGQGGTPDQPIVYQRLLDILRRLPGLGGLTEEQDPFLADLIWWKDEHFAVVEASVVVNDYDVNRAARRAETLQAANVQAIGVVIGAEWLDDEARRQAQARAIQWRVGDDLSDGYLAFCRRPA